MPFLEASVYQVRRVPVEQRHQYGLLVLVMRSWPRGIPRSLIDVWIKDAGPEPETLLAFRQGFLSVEEFARIYEEEQRYQQRCIVRSYAKPSGLVHEITYTYGPLEHLRLLEWQHGKITLLCWESEPPCHRYILRELLLNTRCSYSQYDTRSINGIK